MNKDKVKSFITIVYILLGLTCSYLMVIMSNSIASYRFFSNDTLRISSFGYSFLGFFNNFPNQLFVFILLEAIIAIFIYVFISSFKSGVKEMTIGMQQITDAISIPISAGQGQHGSARFLRNDEIDKCFKSNVIDLNNPVISRLYREGVEEREKLKKIFEEKKQKLKERSQSITSEKKQDEQLKEIVQDMCLMGNFMKKEIVKEKQNNPDKFIPIEDAINDKDNNDGLNFCLGVLAQNLEEIGITTAIEKESSEEEESVKASEMVIQFIMNGMVDKKKFELNFDFGAKRNNELLNDQSEQDIFHLKLKLALAKIFNVPEDEVIIANPQKGNYRVQVIFTNDEMNKMDPAEFEKKCKNSKELEELQYLEEVNHTLIMEGCKLSRNMLDPKGNRFSGWPVGEMRGGKPYNSPVGWLGFGLKVTGKYDNGSDDWLAYDGNENEWAVAYHGVRTKMVSKLEDAVGSIAKTGFKVGKAQVYKDSVNVNQPGNQVGVGIYCSPSPDVLEAYASDSTSSTVIQGKHYIMGFMMRVKPDKIRYPAEEPDYWILNATDDEMRPYRILVKEKN